MFQFLKHPRLSFPELISVRRSAPTSKGLGSQLVAEARENDRLFDAAACNLMHTDPANNHVAYTEAAFPLVTIIRTRGIVCMSILQIVVDICC